MARRNSAGAVALGGILAALALVIQCLGGLIPLATFVCPMLCVLLLAVIFRQCGQRVAWAWYGAVGILGLLLSPDKEAAAVFLFLGYYPIVKTGLDGLPVSWLWKLLLFNAAIAAMYWFLMNLLGLTELSEEFRQMGTAMAVITLALGNLTFFLLDKLLQMRFGNQRKAK